MSSSQDSDAQTPGLGRHSARGVAYLIAGSSVALVANFAGQLALSYLVSPEDVGLVGLAYTVTVFISLFEQGGVGDILVQRKAFRGWAIPGFWLALLLGICCCLAILAVAPIAAILYRAPQLTGVMMVLAPGSIASSLSVVPRAMLYRNLRFRAAASINLASFVLRLLLTVAFAAAGFGAYSYVIPVPLTNIAVAAFLWWWVRPPFKFQIHFHRWKYLIGDSSRLLTIEIQRVMLDQSDNTFLGFFRSPALVGLYWFGFGVSIQLLQLLSFNLMGVLFPTLTKLNDRPQHQYQSFIKAQRILAMIGMSACFLQAAVSRPVTTLFLPQKWEPSIIVMQILCLGMATRMLAASSLALLKAQGELKRLLWIRWSFVVVQISGLLIVLSLGGEIGAVAAVVSIVSTITGLVTFYASILNYNAGWKEVSSVLGRPFLCAATSVGFAWFIAAVLASHGYGYWPQLVETVATAVFLNTLLAWLCMRPTWDDLWMRIGHVLPQRAPAS